MEQLSRVGVAKDQREMICWQIGPMEMHKASIKPLQLF